MIRDDDPWRRWRQALRRQHYPRRTVVDEYPVRASFAARAAFVEQGQRERAKRARRQLCLILLVAAGLVGAVRLALELAGGPGGKRPADQGAEPEHASGAHRHNPNLEAKLHEKNEQLADALRVSA